MYQPTSKFGVTMNGEAVYNNILLRKLVDIFVIVIVDSSQFFPEGFFIQGQAFAQICQGGIGIPQLRIDIADKNHGVFWNIYWKPPC